jgi:hypothetical protein
MTVSPMSSREESGTSRRETPRRSTVRYRVGFKPGHCDRSARCEGHPAWYQRGRGVRGPMAPNWIGAGGRRHCFPTWINALIEDGSLWAGGPARPRGQAGNGGHASSVLAAVGVLPAGGAQTCAERRQAVWIAAAAPASLATLFRSAGRLPSCQCAPAMAAGDRFGAVLD